MKGAHFVKNRRVFLLESKIRFMKYSLRLRGAVSGVLVVLSILGIVYLNSLPLMKTEKDGSFFWNLPKSYQENGYFLSSYIYQKFQSVQKPEHYSGQTVQELMTRLEEETENTIRGELYVSVFGSGTANSEFEFLTGSSMRFLPNGSIPYQAYIDQETPSLASYLKQYGYFTVASHFANRSNWKRDTVYPLLGFDEFLSEPSVKEFECEHGRISDWANYQEVIRRYEQWKDEQTSEHFFCFNVTFQNHGGYLTGYRCENPPHYAGGAADPDVEEYLSTVHVSDQAFQKLVEYFRQEKEPTVIVMFGDHWPRLNNEFLDTITEQDTSAGELEKSQDRYETPYLIWANYDIDAEEGGKLSANYLSTLLLETAGVPLNSYYSFLGGLSEELPVMNSIGYIDAEDDYVGSDTELDEKTQQDLKNYEQLQYELLFGKNVENRAFFDAAVE